MPPNDVSKLTMAADYRRQPAAIQTTTYDHTEPQTHIQPDITAQRD